MPKQQQRHPDQQPPASTYHKTVNVEPIIPPDLASRFANIFAVQSMEGSFLLSFFEALPPVVLGTPEEQAARVEKIQSIQAQCVARIVIPPSRIPELIQALNNIWADFEAGRT